MQLIVDQSLAEGFIPIYTLHQRASLTLKSALGHCLQVKMALLMF